MSALQLVAKDRRDEIVEESIRNGAHATVCHQSPQGWHLYKGAFVHGAREDGVVRIDIRRNNEASSDVVPDVGVRVGVTFRVSHKKCMFNAVIESCQQRDGNITISMRWPDSLKQLQRRAYNRAAPHPGNVVPVRFWREDPCGATDPERRQVRHGQLEDLSAGGMRIKAADLIGIQMGEPYKCVFSPRPGASALVLDAILKHHEALAQARASLGFHFVGLEITDEGQRVLNRLSKIVNEYQRARPCGGR